MCAKLQLPVAFLLEFIAVLVVSLKKTEFNDKKRTLNKMKCLRALVLPKNLLTALGQKKKFSYVVCPSTPTITIQSLTTPTPVVQQLIQTTHHLLAKKVALPCKIGQEIIASI